MFIFQFLNDKIYRYTKKNPIWYLAIWQNWCFGQSYHSKMKQQILQLSLVTGSFKGTRENILHIFLALECQLVHRLSNLLGPKKQGFWSNQL